MRKMFFIALGIILLTSSGCIFHQKITPPKQGTYTDKRDRFYFMQDRWSYLDDTWITAKRVTPYDLNKYFNIPKEQAEKEIKEFTNLQRRFTPTQRFMTSIDLRPVRFYYN